MIGTHFNGYVYGFEVQLSFGTIRNVVRPNRKCIHSSIAASRPEIQKATNQKCLMGRPRGIDGRPTPAEVIKLCSLSNRFF